MSIYQQTFLNFMKKHIITKEQVDQDYNYIGSVNLSDFHIVELAKDLDYKIIFNQSRADAYSQH